MVLGLQQALKRPLKAFQRPLSWFGKALNVKGALKALESLEPRLILILRWFDRQKLQAWNGWWLLGVLRIVVGGISIITDASMSLCF